MKKQLKRSELQKAMEFNCFYEFVTSKLEEGHLVRVIEDAKRTTKKMSILEAMALYQKSLNKAWTADFFSCECKNCNIFIDGSINEDGRTWVGAYLGIPNTPFEFVIAELGDASILEDYQENLTNLHYIEEGKVLRLDPNFKIRVK